MKNLVILFNFSLMLMVATGCGCYKHFPVQNSVRDSVVIRYQDTTIYHLDTIRIELPIESSFAVLASSDSSHLETGLAASDSFIDSTGHLHHTLWNKPGALQKEVLVPEHHHTKEVQEQHQEVQTVTVEVERELTWWQKLWITSGKILWGVMAGALLFLVGKFVIRHIAK